ncbi:Ger(x)C family spore germination protein [Cohnella herbarum]|uniref:Ger(X)C family spore germination protein n=1 Tax=Cohnella herbarum TaxID=2728023 RepID=A0A7Z2VGM5_9BACL|nr:Ger(x)C family spore germination protein [Cohnella herbarum]QJD82742.1 Ger(x)C family spore germination protein [Cohnella herbarum]
MIRSPCTALAFIALVLLTGCWNKYELTEWAFVQAVAVDLSEDDRIRLTTQFYKPGGSLEGATKSSESFNIRTEGDNMSEAISNIANELGRVAQWGHIRIVLVSEKIAENQNIKGILDYFLRDHEPRETAQFAITKGPASDYLNRKPYIESTIGQQLREISQSSKRITGMSKQMNLLQVAIALKSQTGIAVLPYMASSGGAKDPVMMNGVAIFRDYSIVKPGIPAGSAEYLLMLRDEYERGVVIYPCEENPKAKKDTFEHVMVSSSTKVEPKGESVAVRINLLLTGGYGELRCSKVRQASDETRIKQKITEYVERELQKEIASMQARQLDLLNIGDALYRRHPALWLKWKSTWGKRLSQATFQIKVEIQMTNTGLTKPLPYGSQED